MELQKLNEYPFKSQATKKSYLQQYKKLRGMLDADISDTSQRKILEAVKEVDNINSQQALINIAILMRRMYEFSVDKLEKKREYNKDLINSHRKEKNTELQDKLPDYEELKLHMNDLYEDKKWTDYIINYLLINYYVRNKDLLFEIVELKRQMTDKTKNYMWLYKRKKQVVYRRNDYKTANTYGRKEVVITDPDFYTAVLRVFNCQKLNLNCGEFIPNESQLGYYIKQATYKHLGETVYMKIMVKHYKNDLQKLKEISQSRGTSLDTIIESYDVSNQ